MTAITNPSDTASVVGTPRTGRLEILDGLRLIAALMVVLYHYTYRSSAAWGERAAIVFSDSAPVSAYGWLGVNLFFIISGFVICMSAWGRDLRQFAVSRLARLFPAYWFGVFATVLAVFLIDLRHPLPSLGQLLVNLTMLQEPFGVGSIDGVYWTLWIELRFYFLFAAMIWWGLTYRRVVAFCAIWTIVSAIAASTSHQGLIALVDANHSPYFVAGITLFLVYRFGASSLLLMLVAFSWGLSLWRVLPMVSFVNTLGPRELWWPGVVIVMSAIFVVMTVVALGWLSWIRGAWLTVAGTLTYPVYLIHQEIGYSVIARIGGDIPRWPLVISLIAAMLGLAWLVHRFVERPLASLMKRSLTKVPAPAGRVIPAMRRRGSPVKDKDFTAESKR